MSVFLIRKLAIIARIVLCYSIPKLLTASSTLRYTWWGVGLSREHKSKEVPTRDEEGPKSDTRVTCERQSFRFKPCGVHRA